jgi:hypothetical protein
LTHFLHGHSCDLIAAKIREDKDTNRQRQDGAGRFIPHNDQKIGQSQRQRQIERETQTQRKRRQDRIRRRQDDTKDQDRFPPQIELSIFATSSHRPKNQTKQGKDEDKSLFETSSHRPKYRNRPRSRSSRAWQGQMRGGQTTRQEDKAKTKQDEGNDKDNDLRKISGNLRLVFWVGK